MEILPACATGQPTILLARAGKYDPDGRLEAAEQAGAWAGLEEGRRPISRRTRSCA